MKSKMKIRHTMILSVIFSAVLFSCTNAPKQSSHPSRTIDSIAVVYDRELYLSFADITSKEFIQFRHDSLFYIRDRDTIRYLSDRIDRLTSAKDSLTPDVNTRVMLVLYSSYGNNDSLFVSTFPRRSMQLNDITKFGDSILWMEIRDIIFERDSLFYMKFKDFARF